MHKLGVNIDHVATLRQARGEEFPDPVKAATICEKAGADSIVCHLRQDRRHIQDRDLWCLRETIRTRLNLEMSTTDEIVKIALKVKPNQVTFVPEKRQELTTEGGLDVIKHKKRIASVADIFYKKDIKVSLFIDPLKSQVDAAKDIGVPYIELHTGMYATAKSSAACERELKRISDVAEYAHRIGLGVNAGHGLNYDNVKAISNIDIIEELNIGFSIIAESVFIGLERAVKDMKHLIG